MTNSRADARQRNLLWILIPFCLCLLPLCLLGYGSDNDSFGVLSAGRSTWHLHIPITSRGPGYWTYEAIVFVLSSIGGYVLTNLASLAVATALVWRFLVVAGRLGVRFPVLVAGCLIVTPVFLIAATSADDYLWSLLGIVLFAECVVAGRFALAILPAALAFALRGSNGTVIAGAVIGFVVADLLRHKRIGPESLKLIGTGLAAALLGCVPYVESWRLGHYTMRYLRPDAGPAAMWTPKMRVGRFFFKGTYLFGPLAWIALAASAFLREPAGLSSPPSTVETYRARFTPLAIGICVANAILFFGFSIEVSYLLPGACFLLLLAGTTWLAKSRTLTFVFCLAILSLDFVTPRIAEPNIPGVSTGARIHPGIEEGKLVDDIHQRIDYRTCSDAPCYDRVSHALDPDSPTADPFKTLGTRNPDLP